MECDACKQRAAKVVKKVEEMKETSDVSSAFMICD